jgi:hypothetical protein
MSRDTQVYRHRRPEEDLLCTSPVRAAGVLVSTLLLGLVTACGSDIAESSANRIPATSAPTPAQTMVEPALPEVLVEPPAHAPVPAPGPNLAVEPKTGAVTEAASTLVEGYPFGPSSVWRSVIRDAPLARNSAAMVNHLAGTVSDRYGGVAAFNAYQYNNSYYVAAPGTRRVDVAFHDCQGKGHTPGGLSGHGGHFTDVPIPDGAVPSPGDDKALSIYAPETDQLWEFWVVERTDDGWSACWGGRIDNVSRNPGYFSDGFGATATGLAGTGGMVRLADVRSGRIEHAMALAIPNPRIWYEFSWPAQRSDGWDENPDAAPEGTRLRLDPSIDVSTLGLHPVATMIAEAAQEYGFIVVDKAGSVSVIAESGAPEQAATGVDPWAVLLVGSQVYDVLAGFPWDRLQALPRDYGKP